MQHKPAAAMEHYWLRNNLHAQRSPARDHVSEGVSPVGVCSWLHCRRIAERVEADARDCSCCGPQTADETGGHQISAHTLRNGIIEGGMALALVVLLV